MKYEVTYSCGHNGVVELFGKGSDREYQLMKYRDRICPECYARQAEAKRAEGAAKVAELKKSVELASLSGSEKQVAWAESIRVEAVKAISGVKPGMEQAALDMVNKVTDATWWIDRRSYTGKALLKAAINVARGM